MSESPVRRRADAERNRAHILDTAAEVLRTEPTASFEDVIAATRLARTTVYRHFPTRDDLVNELAARALRAVRATLEHARPAEPPFADALDRMTRAALTAGGEVWDLLDIVGEERLASSPPVADIVAAVTAMMGLGAAEGALRDDIPTAWLVDIYFTALSSAVRDRRTDEAGVELVVGLFLRGAGRDAAR
ncbi:TetR/AcrR family transcriptional regulator [Streptomyces longwoodensis]|uniref:TetR/AcrR family transcriptional regulator n=1 Tax=Streptomyces longwoodensis TaxID=68231 RepID=UPI00340EC572